MSDAVHVDAVRADAFHVDAFRVDCPARFVLDHITGKWAILILTGLREGPRRFSELHVKVAGISEKMLAQTLRTLVRDGLIARTVHPTTPPTVSYGLTQIGEEIAPLLHEMLTWIGDHATDMYASYVAHVAP